MPAKRDFTEWFSHFRASIADYSYYLNVPKIVEHAKRHKAELCLLNALIGEAEPETTFRELVTKYPTALSAVPILLAKREYEIVARDHEGGGVYSFSHPTNTLDDYCVFMRKTGLFDLLSKHLVNNLYDYVLGVEAGLDSNGRKNRGGHLMEDHVARVLTSLGVPFEREVNSSLFQKRWGIDISPLTNADKTLKRFDFVVKTPRCVYAIETNFYGSGGSKLNETARSYKMLALEARNIPRFKFVWVTDGAGWQSACHNLQETFEALPATFNLHDLESGAFADFLQ